MACDKVSEAQSYIGGKIVYLECEDKPILNQFYSDNGFFRFGTRDLDEDEKGLMSSSQLVQMLKYLSRCSNITGIMPILFSPAATGYCGIISTLQAILSAKPITIIQQPYCHEKEKNCNWCRQRMQKPCVDAILKPQAMMGLRLWCARRDSNPWPPV